jgi:hypothetical protein
LWLLLPLLLLGRRRCRLPLHLLTLLLLLLLCLLLLVLPPLRSLPHFVFRGRT